MTNPQDPFATPDQPGMPPQQPGPPQEGYGAPPPPAPPGYGPPPPGYGQPPEGYGQPPAYGQPLGGASAPYAGSVPELAPWGTRVAAALIDFVIIFFAQIVVSIASRGLAQLVALAIEIYFAYLVGTKGQSPGKSAMKIRVLRETDGQLLGFGTAVLRWIAHILDALPLLLGFLWPLWDKKNQTFADKIVGSVVVRA